MLRKDGDGSVVRLGGHGDGVGDVVGAGPGVVALGYSKLLRARRIRPNARNARAVEPN